MRRTRAALRAEGIHIDDIVTPELAASEVQEAGTKGERAPLGDITPNSLEEPREGSLVTDQVMGFFKKGKGRGKKGKGGRKKKQDAEMESIANREGSIRMATSQPEVLEDERRAAGSPASDAAVEDLIKEPAIEVSQAPLLDHRPVSPPVRTRATRRTRRQLALEAEELARSQTQQIAVETMPEIQIQEPEPRMLPDSESVKDEPSPLTPTRNELTPATTPEPQAPTIEHHDEPINEVAVELSQEPKSLSPLKQSETPVGQLSPRSPLAPVLRPEDSIEAIDALEEVIEELDKALPPLDSPTSPEKPRKMARVQIQEPETRPAAKVPSAARPNIVKRAKSVSKLSEKAADAKLQTTNGSRHPSLRRSQSMRSFSKDSPTPDKPKPKPEVFDYLASRRGPISISFPEPPPPPKSKKPPTRPTFTLPGEVIAAKIRAQREERLRREEEEAQKRREFKARPIMKPVAAPVVKQTVASKARESLMHGLPLDFEPEKEKTKTGKRAASTATTATGKRIPSLTTKRSSVHLSSSQSTRPSSTATQNSTSDAGAQRSTSLGPSRTSTFARKSSGSGAVGPHVANTSKPRIPSNPGPITKSTITPADVAAQKQRHREIFQRDRAEKDEFERQRREKEEAAKRARAEAAERGRQASREWAERQRRKMLAAAATKRADSETKVAG